MKRIIIILALLSFCSCSSIKSTTQASHSCPEEGHGPCYLKCDETKKSSKFNEWDFMFAFTGI